MYPQGKYDLINDSSLVRLNIIIYIPGMLNTGAFPKNSLNFLAFIVAEVTISFKFLLLATTFLDLIIKLL